MQGKRKPPQKPKRGPGRPTKLTPETRQKIIAHIMGGNYRYIAAGAMGVAPRTFRTWLKQDEGFSAEVLEAERLAEIAHVARIERASETDAKHSQWWLERKANKRWGRKDRIEAKVKGRISVELPQELAEMLDQVLTQ